MQTETKIIYLEQLLAGLLLKFKTIDHLALKFIGEDISKINFVHFGFQSSEIESYVEETPYGYKLKDECFDEKGEILLEVKQALNNYNNSIVIDYLNELSIEDLVIRKVVDMEIATPADINLRFSEEEKIVLKRLVNERYLENIWNGNDKVHEDYMEVVLDRLGKKRAFELEFPECVIEFKKLVASSGYDVTLVDGFLEVQDYDKGIYEILNIDNFLSYCETYGKCAVVSGISQVEYKSLEYKKGEGFTKEGQELFSNMLSVIDDGHCIHVCHPNHLFNTKYVIGTNLELDKVNWEDIDIFKMMEVGDYKTFVMPDVKEAFRYVHKRLGHQVMKKIELNQNEKSYLVVVEQYLLDGEDNYLVRGIIRGDRNGYSMAFNPVYEKTIATNIWEKSIRFSGNEVPEAYLVKRPSKPINRS